MLAVLVQRSHAVHTPVQYLFLGTLHASATNQLTCPLLSTVNIDHRGRPMFPMIMEISMYNLKKISQLYLKMLYYD